MYFGKNHQVVTGSRSPVNEKYKPLTEEQVKAIKKLITDTLIAVRVRSS